jgi:hypothetical protein
MITALVSLQQERTPGDPFDSASREGPYAFRTLLAKDTKSAMQQGDRKGSPLLYTNGAACQARL